MGNLFSDRNRAKAVATFLGAELPSELRVMEERRKAALSVELELNVPDVTRLDPKDVAAALNGAKNASEDTFNRVRMAAVSQIERAYTGLVTDYVKASFPAVAARYNEAAKTFVENYRIDRFPMIYAEELDPAGLSASDIGLYANARDAHKVLTDAVDLTLKHIISQEVGRAEWHRKVALCVAFDSYEDAYNLANMDKNTSRSLFGLFGVVVRENHRAQREPFPSTPYALSMPSTLDDYHARMNDLLNGPGGDWGIADPTALVAGFGRR